MSATRKMYEESRGGTHPANHREHGSALAIAQTTEDEALPSKRVVVEHRIGRLVQLGVRQAKYFGKAKTGFQIALVATVANLMLAAAISGAASPAAGPLVALVAIASLAFHCLATQEALLEMTPSRPGL